MFENISCVVLDQMFGIRTRLGHNLIPELLALFFY